MSDDVRQTSRCFGEVNLNYVTSTDSISANDSIFISNRVQFLF